MMEAKVFRGVTLQAEFTTSYPPGDLAGNSHVALSPRCQCLTRVARPVLGPEVELIEDKSRPARRLMVGATVACSLRRLGARPIHFPAWVAKSAYCGGRCQWLVDASAAPIDVLPRFQFASRSLLGKSPNTFRTKPAQCRCMVRWDLPATHADIINGLGSADKLLKQVGREQSCLVSIGI